MNLLPDRVPAPTGRSKAPQAVEAVDSFNYNQLNYDYSLYGDYGPTKNLAYWTLNNSMNNKHRGNLRISIPIFQDDYTFVAKNAIKKSALCEYFTYQSLVQDIWEKESKHIFQLKLVLGQ